jgi:7-carboxy-7-deazaguanine synthase
MRIAELYASLQGEGLLAGTPSSFVRTSGCNLRCHWCDTPFTSWEPTGAWRSAADVAADVLALGRRHAVVTGGEPLLAADLPDLCRLLRAAGLHVTLETAGSVPSPAAADLVSISPKLASSAPPDDTPGGWAGRHAAARRRDDVLLGLMRSAPYQLKFVVESMADLAETDAWIADLAAALPGGIDRGRVFLMPQGRSPHELATITRWLAAECRSRGFHLGHRHHIEWFGHTRGT